MNANTENPTAPHPNLQVAPDQSAGDAAVRIGFMPGFPLLPLLIEPRSAGVDPLRWAEQNRALIASELTKYGAILFRGFTFTEAMFEPFINATSTGALPYTERSSPRSRVSGNVFTSTDYPPRHPIFPHNEQSYNRVFPTKIYFMCVIPAERQGATPLCDCRRIYRQLAPSIRDRFAGKKYMYTRNFGGGLGLDWQDAFQTAERSEAETYCRDNGIAFEWRGNDELRTRQIREVVARHPVSGELSWFNHLTFFHVSTLPSEVRDALLMATDEEDLPNNTYYGDGTRIEGATLDTLRSLYELSKVSFPWQARDVLIVDNMLVAHGREPFTGTRRVLAGMADPCPWTTASVSLTSRSGCVA
jgi:alpha-ketoglutarate-dependent taurine dioxygenase